MKADADSKLLTEYTVTPANVHDSQPMPAMINGPDKAVYADSAYRGSVVAEAPPQNVDNHIQKRCTKKQPLTEEQKTNNRIKSKTRCRIEHIFGFMTNPMHGIAVRSVGLLRAEFNIGLTNLIYNLCRFEFLNRPVSLPSRPLFQKIRKSNPDKGIFDLLLSLFQSFS